MILPAPRRDAQGLLAIDIGNTTIALGLFRGEKLVRRFSFPTKACDYQVFLKKIFRHHKIDAAIVCSVVPQATLRLARSLRRFLGRRAHYIGKDVRVPLKNLYRKASLVGQDRLVNAYAGVVLYGAPLIIVDFGTAVTFDVVSRRKEYLGGMIVPGLQMSLDALAERTALLPRVQLAVPPEFIGRDTRGSLLSGMVNGMAVLTDGLAGRIRAVMGKHTPVIGTGGNIHVIRAYCRSLTVVDRDLTLKGLYLIYKKNS